MSGVQTIVLGGVEYDLAPLSFRALKQHKETIRRMTEGSATSVDDLYESMASIVHASIARAHPGVTLEMVEEALDWPAARRAVDAVLRASFPQAPEGELGAESQSGISTGTPASAK